MFASVQAYGRYIHICLCPTTLRLGRPGLRGGTHKGSLIVCSDRVYHLRETIAYVYVSAMIIVHVMERSTSQAANRNPTCP